MGAYRYNGTKKCIGVSVLSRAVSRCDFYNTYKEKDYILSVQYHLTVCDVEYNVITRVLVTPAVWRKGYPGINCPVGFIRVYVVDSGKYSSHIFLRSIDR